MRVMSTMSMAANGTTCLTVAAARRDAGIVQLLLEHGADVHQVGESKETALHHAATAEIATLLIDAGADMTAVKLSTDAAWVKPFALKAIAEGDAAMLEVMAERDVDVVALEWNGDSALHFAVKAGHMAIVRNLISHGANINAVDTAGNPPLFLASESGHPELIQELVVNGADVNALNTYEETVLQDTVKRGRAALALWLVEHGADVHAVDSMGFSIPSWVEMAEVREAVRSLGQLVLEHEVQFFQAAARARASSVPPVLPSSPETINGGKRPGGQLTSTPKNKLRREPQEP